MVADLTRYSACRVLPDADRPIRLRRDGMDEVDPKPPGTKDGDVPAEKPVRLFAWVSA
ncbi:MAG: hypothetical protein ABW048_06480 [Sphingobium sp.]